MLLKAGMISNLGRTDAVAGRAGPGRADGPGADVTTGARTCPHECRY